MSKILIREKGPKDPLDDTERFRINDKFINKNRKMNLIGKKNLQNRDKVKDQSEINDMRKYQVEAAIVRIMKSNKKLLYEQLSLEVRKVIESFSPADRQLRMIVDDLIKREYLERDQANRNQLYYKA